jgi:hypothetical protein
MPRAAPKANSADLVRLAPRAQLAIIASHLSMKASEVSKTILAGYIEGLQAGGRPFVLVEHHQQLKNDTTNSLSEPDRFWKKLERLPTVNHAIPSSAISALERGLPEAGLRYRVIHRFAGLGSLGRQRWVALGEWRGGSIAREVKAQAPSAWVWAHDRTTRPERCYQTIVDQAVRAPDPSLSARRQALARAAARAGLLAHRVKNPER